MSPRMPYSPLDALLDCLPRVRKAGKVTKTDDVLSVQKRIADVFLPIVKRIQAEARHDEARRCAADVCEFCRDGNEPERQENFWTHGDGDEFCDAGDIHERLHRESQKGGNHEKTDN